MVPSGQAEQRYSICIGINRYPSSTGLSTLKYAEDDAQAMDQQLGVLGFAPENRVLLLNEEATLQAVNEALSDIILDQATGDDLVIFYYAGHSVPFRLDDSSHDTTAPQSEVFLATYDFDRQRIKQKRSFREQQALGLERLKGNFFEGKGPRKRLFLLDSCYSGDFYGPGYRDATDPVQGYIQHVFETKSTGRLVLSSCLPIQKAVEDPALEHGRFTYYVLKALAGKAPEAARPNGDVTVNSLFEYLSSQLPDDQRPVLGGVQQDVFVLVNYPELVRQNEPHSPVKVQVPYDREHRLHALLADHTGFLQNRLESFIGREAELAEIRQQIVEKMQTGGYVTITGQAGQGKSSVIAKLVEEYGPENVAYHFIPFNPGPDHQVGLLRNLMARLILKYNLSDLYVAAESRPALRDYFPKVLMEVAEKNGHEVIFVDGLDQIEEDMSGVRDLSFLPNNPPPGIIFVIGTRPNDTLRPLELLKPRAEYQLPNLKREDFSLVLAHRQIHLEPHLADQFYQAMQENALYLDLVAKELQENGSMTPQEMIARIASNPENIFSLSVIRFKRHPTEWREVIKPILGVLLAAREPLSHWQIRNILRLEDNQLRDGLARLGGLIAATGEQRYTLFHLKLLDYLRQDENQPQNEYIFASDEEEHWHAILAKWCERGSLALIWKEAQDAREQGRRAYARRHYITHLYYARMYQQLFAVLDEGTYGQAKEYYDLSTRSYIRDLDLGRRAVEWNGWTQEEGIALLPALWRYTLLRGSLRSRADQYPQNLFQVFLLLHRESEVLGLAELLTDVHAKIQVLLQMALHLNTQPTRQQESSQLFLRAYSVAASIEESTEKDSALRKLVSALAKAHLWEQAEVVARSIEESYEKASALRELARALVEAQHWEQAEAVAKSIEDDSEKVSALSELASALIKAQHWKQAQHIWIEAKAVARSIEESYERASALRELASALAEAQCWEQAEAVARSIEESYERASALSELASALAGTQLWEQAEAVARSIEGSYERASVLRQLASALVKVQHREQAQHIWIEAEIVARSIEKNSEKASVLRELASAQSKAQLWEQTQHIWIEAEIVARSIEKNSEKAFALRELAGALSKAQHWEQAEAVARSIGDASALSELASALAEAQCWEQAEAVARSIEESSAKASALRQLAGALSEAHLWEQAQHIWIEAETVARSITEGSVLRELANALVKVQQWERAEAVARSIKGNTEKDSALRHLASALAEVQQWEQAEAVARSIEESDAKASALSELASALIKAQHWKQAQRFCIEAEAVARSIEKNTEKDSALSELASALIKAQHWKQAEIVARSIERSTERTSALSELASALAEAQLWEQAETVARSIEWCSKRTSALSELASALTEAQLWEQAETVARSIMEGSAKASAFRRLAEALVKTQHWEWAQYIWIEAEAVARSIENSYEKDSALRQLANALAKTQHWEQAEAVARSIENSHEKASAFRHLVEALAEAQHWEQAEAVARSIEKSSERPYALSKLANALAKAQHWEQAEAVARSVEKNSEKLYALRELVVALGKAQRWKQAETVARSIEKNSWESYYALRELASALAEAQCWEQAEAVARSIEESSAKASALSELAGALAEAQHWEQAEIIARSIEESSAKDSALSELAGALAEAQHWEQAETVAKSIEKSSAKASVLRELASALVKAQHWEQAQHIWIEAEIVARSIEKNTERASALRQLASALVKVQHREQAQHIWIEAEIVARSIEKNTERASALRQLAEALAEVQQWKLLLSVIQRAWLFAETREYACQLLPLARGFIVHDPQLGMRLYEAFIWVQNFLNE